MSSEKIEEIETQWDEFSDFYSTYDICPSVLYLSLLNMLKLETKNSILEVGAGSGSLYHHMLNRKKPTAKYVATDISDKMLDIMCKRIQITRNNNETVHNEQYNLQIQKVNGEQLPFADNSFDCYIANLCLHITPDPVKMLSETHRVLQKGGVAGFSVWGNDSEQFYYTIISSVQKELGTYKQVGKSYFALNDREKLIKMFEDGGFTNIICWNQFTPFQYTTEAEMRENMGDEFNKEVTERVIQKFNHLLQVKKKPFGLDGLLIIGTKK